MWTPGTSTLPNLPQVYLLGPGETLQNWFCRFSPRNKFTKVSSIPYMLGLCKTLRIQRWIEHNFCSKALFCFLNQVGKQTLHVARLTGLYWPWELGARNPWRAVFTKPTLRSLHTRARGQVRGWGGGASYGRCFQFSTENSRPSTFWDSITSNNSASRGGILFIFLTNSLRR